MSNADTAADTTQSHVSLIDLNKQFNFLIDEALKTSISFAETLIISCGHFEGAYCQPGEGSEGDAFSDDSSWTCTSTNKEEEQVEEEQKKDEPYEIKDYVEPEVEEEEKDDDYDDFHFYFFPDCNKPPKPVHSKDSLIIGPNGMPRINPRAKEIDYCVCPKNKQGECDCHVKLICYCCGKKAMECICAKRSQICICDDDPHPVCVCDDTADVCVCAPGAPKPKCTCGAVKKPCVCYPDKFPSPVCTCKGKPKFGYLKDLESIPSFVEEEIGEKSITSMSEEGSEEITDAEPKISKPKIPTVTEGPEPCECTKPEPEPHCLCLKDQPCTCNRGYDCVCGVQKTCVCTPDSSDNQICKSEESKSICSCDVEKVCTCEKHGEECKCFPKTVCSCKNPEKCACLKICDCGYPCICDIAIRKADECVCLDKAKQIQRGYVCKCGIIKKKPPEPTVIKKKRAGKYGYRWCYHIDPKHTYFDYGYDMHDRIKQEKQDEEKFKILGLHDEVKRETDLSDVCPVHGVKITGFKKKVRKPSIDCCNTVGGINISIETLGEDRNKFLVQVISNSSKEGSKTSSKLVSILDMNLHTLEENRSERITKQDLVKERRSYMAICESGYYNKITYICGDRNSVKRYYHTFDIAHNFILEGANVVLLRYFAIRRYKGTIQTDTVLMNGLICASIYVCLGVHQSIVNQTPMAVIKVERHIIEPNGYIHQTLTVLTGKGYVISHEWADNNYIFHLNPLLRVNPETEDIEPHAPLRSRWREDLQLFSDFLDFKSTRTSEGARYVAENGVLTDTIRDYLQAVLLLKPRDVIHFTRHYFDSAMSALDLPHNEYFDNCTKHVRYYYFEE